MKSIKKQYQVDRRHIGYVRFILEAYDGIAVMTTVDSGAGIVSLSIPPDFEPDTDRLMTALGREVGLKALAALT